MDVLLSSTFNRNDSDMAEDDGPSPAGGLRLAGRGGGVGSLSEMKGIAVDELSAIGCCGSSFDSFADSVSGTRGAIIWLSIMKDRMSDIVTSIYKPNSHSRA